MLISGVCFRCLGALQACLDGLILAAFAQMKRKRSDHFKGLPEHKHEGQS